MNSHLTARAFSEAVVTLEQSEQLVIEHGRGRQRHLALTDNILDRANGVEQ